MEAVDFLLTPVANYGFLGFSVVLLAVVVLLLVLSANPVAGTWYSQGGTELIFLKNGKGMTVPDGAE